MKMRTQLRSNVIRVISHLLITGTLLAMFIGWSYGDSTTIGRWLGPLALGKSRTDHWTTYFVSQTGDTRPVVAESPPTSPAPSGSGTLVVEVKRNSYSILSGFAMPTHERWEETWSSAFDRERSDPEELLRVDASSNNERDHLLTQSVLAAMAQAPGRWANPVLTTTWSNGRATYTAERSRFDGYFFNALFLFLMGSGAWRIVRTGRQTTES